MDDINALEESTPPGEARDAVTVESRQVEEEEPLATEKVDGEDVEDVTDAGDFTDVEEDVNDSICCCTRCCSLCLPSCCMRWPHR